MKEVYALLSVTIMTGSLIPYVVALWKKEAKPHAFSWILWGLVTTVVCAAQISKGAGPGAWAAGSAGAVSFALGGYALKYGEKNITKSDWAVFIYCYPLAVLTVNTLFVSMLLWRRVSIGHGKYYPPSPS